MTLPIPRHRIVFSIALVMLAATLAGCETTGTGVASASAVATKPAEPAKPPEPPMTHARAATLCWMGTEKGHADADLDKRADIVTKCIEDKMKAAAETPKS